MPGATHALLSPSAAARWVNCPGSVALTADMPNPSSSYAEEGTCAHRLAELLLTGHTVDDIPDQDVQIFANCGVNLDDLIAPVSVYVDYVRSIPGELRVECEIDIGGITGEVGAHGTADAIILGDDELHICDLKFGIGEKVDAENNLQLSIYAQAALDAYGWLADFQRVHLHIIQPRLNHISDWSISLQELGEVMARVKASASVALNGCTSQPDASLYCPSRKACRWCLARGKCPHLAKYCLSAAGVDDGSLEQFGLLDASALSDILGKLDLIAKWSDAVREAAHAELMAGGEVPGYKLVQGREGIRKWADEKAVDKLLKAWKIPADARYKKKLISPADAGKLYKAHSFTDEQWAELCGSVVRSSGKIEMVEASDPRPAVTGGTTADQYPDESK